MSFSANRAGPGRPSDSPLSGEIQALCERLPWRGDPTRVALALRGAQRPVALIGKWAGGGALLADRPAALAPGDADPFAVIERQPPLGPATGAGPGFVGGGWFGYLGYRLGRGIEHLNPAPWPPGRLPDRNLAFYDHLLRMDRDGVWWFEALVSESRRDLIEARLAQLREGTPAATAEPFTTAPWSPRPGLAGHGRAVAACRERIRAGDLFQANICLKLTSRISGDPLDLFTRAAADLAPDRAAFLAGPWGAVASLSPELYLERHGRRVRSAPIKGTAPRSHDPGQVDSERRRLAGSAKDQAENRMILDLVRNDLGRVCTYGSIAVTAAADPRPHTGVWHLVSEVTGELHETRGDRDLLRATFPPASVTGAPKIAAENVIAELESSSRDVYTGAIGFVSPCAGLEFSVAIRTFEFDQDQAWLGLGGGIVADSDPEAEARECRTKAAPLLVAIGAEFGPEPEPGSSAGAGYPIPLPPRLGPRPLARPDPAAGLIETIRVERGVACELDSHLGRLRRSLAELYGTALPAGLAESLRQVAAAGVRSRLRCRVSATGQVEIELLPTAERQLPVELMPVTVPGGIGSHKWADRELIETLSRAVAPRVPLICDLDGTVLEAAYANLFAEFEAGELVTPPLDGRILPGVARAAVIADPAAAGLPPGPRRRVSERPLGLAELPRAGALYLTSSIAGPHPATLTH